MSERLSARYSLGHRQIRLVTLRHSLFMRRIRISFLVVNLDDCPEYTAYSYVWGDDTPVMHINSGGGLHIELAASAAEIIEELSSGAAGFIWIDTLCIDQGDPEEKSKQVELMAEVYSSAKRVIVWLGRQMQDGDLALRFVSELDAYFLKCEASGIALTEKIITEAPKRITTGWRKWKALAILLKCSLFERMWIVQEVVMAPFKLDQNGIDDGATLICRKVALSFRIFVRVVDTLMKLGTAVKILLADFRDSFPRAMGCAVEMGELRQLRLQNRTISFDYALRKCSEFQATYGVDKIYAVRNFVQRDAFVDTLRTNYTDKGSVEELFTKVAVGFLKQENPFQFLHIAGIGWPRRLVNLASWVPDWNRPYSFQVYGHYSPENAYSASSSECSEPIINSKDQSLTVKIVRVDRVRRIFGHPPIESLRSPIYDLGRLVRMAYDFARESPYYSSLRSNIEGKVMAPFLVVNRLQEDEVELKRRFHSWLDYTEGEGTGSPATRNKIYPAWIKFFEAIQFAMAGHRAMFGTCEHGFLGWGPTGLQVDDEICIIIGASTPFILRPLENVAGMNLGAQRWRLVGECYIQGLMNGEGLSLGRWEPCVIV